MKTAEISRSMLLWCSILTLLLFVAWLGVIPARSEDASVVTFYVH
jgi:hypothetical protein